MANIWEAELVNIISSYDSKGKYFVEDAKEILKEVKDLVEGSPANNYSDHIIGLNECRENSGMTSIYLISLCAYRNLPEVADYLLSKGADPDLANKWGGRTALHFVVDNRELEFIKILCSYDTNFNAKCMEGSTPLHSLSKRFSLPEEMLEVVNILIENGADVNSVDAYGDSILHSAAYYGHSDLISILLDNNANPDLKNANGETPLQILEAEDELEDSLQIFKQHKSVIFQKEIDISNKQKNRIKTGMSKRSKIGGFKR